MTTTSNSPQDLLPLNANTFQVLFALAEGEKHGYGIRKAVEEETDGLVKIRIGSLYSLIQRLTDAGLIEESEARPAPEMDDERRRYYRLTDFGLRVLQEEARRLKTLIAQVDAKGLLNSQV